MLATTIGIGMPPAWQSAVTQIRAESKVEKFYPIQNTPPRFLYSGTNAVTSASYSFHHNTIASLGWSEPEALETHLRLRSFAEDWNYPGMEAYDAL